MNRASGMKTSTGYVATATVHTALTLQNRKKYVANGSQLIGITGRRLRSRLGEWIYLDYASMAPAMPFLNPPFGNPSSAHAIGQRARDALEDARGRVAKCMDCKPSEVYFTSTATEAAVLALDSLYREGVKVTASPYEHHSISENVRELESPLRMKTCYCQQLVNNECGDIFSYRPAGDYWLCDATAAVGHIPVSFDSDYMVADGIKFGSMHGAAFLLAKEGVPLFPMIRGGGQERGIRAGTENVPAICSMASALEWQCQHMEQNTLHVLRLNKMMLQILTEADCLVNAMGETSPYILNVSFLGVENGALVLYLSNQGVMVSAGAACTTGDNAPSHVLMAMYGDEARARSAIRISFSHDTTEEEVRIAGDKIVKAVKMLRGMM